MVIPERALQPPRSLISLAPGMIETFKFFKINNGPFLTIFIVDFQMMEVKGHRQLVALRC